MRVLHLCSYYIGNKLYKNMVETLDEKGIQQEIYIPIRNENHFNKNITEKEDTNIEYHYDLILGKRDKYFYKNKIKKQVKSVEQKILNQKNIDFIHAHTVFSDGGAAYELKKKYGIDYLVTFRNTDINSFYKYAIHLRPFMYKILLNASKIVFISEAYKQKIMQILPINIERKITNKIVVIPNGVDNYWIESSNKNMKRELKKNRLNLLFIGELNENKNLTTVIHAVEKIFMKNKSVKLDVIGSGPLETVLKKKAKGLGIKKIVEFHGYIKDKDVIKNIMMQNDIFIMPSFKETFGLVYVEAMSQGLPIIYTEYEGIDGLFEDGKVGYAVNPVSEFEVIESIEKIQSNYEVISKQCIKCVEKFDWNRITQHYIDYYKECD